jgi:hypothetical protein
MVNGERPPVNAMSQAALGRALGLSPASVTKLKGQGMPVDSVEAAQAWREARQNLAQRKPAPPDVIPVKRWQPFDAGPFGGARPESAGVPISVGGVPVFGGGPPDFSELPDEDRDAARTRREIAEANMAEMMEARQRREQIRVVAVQEQLAKDYATTRDAMLQLSARMAPLLAVESDPAKVQHMLEAEIHQALTALAGASDKVPQIEGAFD